MNIALPKRSDPIYKEIEEFKDYEFTNCIAYEMAVRNFDVDILVGQLLLIENNVENLILLESEILCSEGILVEEHKKKEYKILTSKLNGYGLNYFDYIVYKNNENMLKKFDPTINMVFSLNKEKMREILEIEHKYIEGLELKEKEKQLKRFKVFKIGYEYQEESKKILKNFFTKENLKISKDSLSLSRGELKINDHTNYDISFNLNLPKEELVAYISKIKDEYDKDNSIIKSPLELLGEVLENADNKKINKSLIADKFFIYDYVTARQEQIRENNELRCLEYEEQLHEIKNNPYITSKDRKIQQTELKKEFEENTNVRKKELFENIKNFAAGTASKYYYDIKPFIDDCKYKELITGTKL